MATVIKVQQTFHFRVNLEENPMSGRWIDIGDNQKVNVGVKRVQRGGGGVLLYLISPFPVKYDKQISDVYFSYDMMEKIFMSVKLNQSKVQYFGSKIALPYKRKYDFWITMKDAVGEYCYQRMDKRMEDLWLAANNRFMTDVEFVVGDRVFHAHKSAVASRSPVFDAMFHNDMLESRTNRVTVDDIDAAAFERLLYFIYTGTLKCAANDHALLMAADKYQVETLKNLCQRATVEFGAEELATLILELTD